MTSLSQLSLIRGRQQLSAAIERDFNNDPAQLVTSIDREISRLLRVDLKEAARLLKTFERLVMWLPSEFRPRVDGAKGRLAHWSGRYAEALNHYLRALRTYERAKDGLNVARTRRGLMDVYMYIGKYDRAIEQGKKAQSYFQRKKMLNDAAQVMTNIGNIYHRMDSNRQALKYYDRAREIFAPGGGMPLALVEYNRANIYANLNQLETARELYQFAARLYHEAGMGLAETQAIYSLAYLYFLENRFTEASSVLEDVHDKFETFGDAKSAAVANLDLVEIDLHLNQYGSAVFLGSNLIGLFRELGMRYEEAKIQYFVAWAHIKLGDFRPASRALEAARRLFEKEKNKLWCGVVESAYSRMYLGMNKSQLAAQRARKAINLFRLSGDERRRIDAEIGLAEAVLQAGNYRQAVSRVKRLLDGKLVTYQRFDAAQVAGKAFYSRGMYEKALDMFREAVQQVERMLSGLYPDEVQFFFVLDKLDAYNLLVDCQLKLGKVDSALSTALIGLRTVNAQKISDVRLKQEIPPELLKTRNRLRAIMARSTMNPGESGSTRGLGSASSVEQKIWATERKIRSRLYAQAGSVAGPFPTLAKIQAALRADEVLITPVVAAESIGVFRTTKSDNRFIGFKISRHELEVLLRKIHFLFENAVLGWRADDLSRKSVRFYLEQLYGELIAPLSLDVSTRSLIVLVQDIFAQIPFAAILGVNGTVTETGPSVKLALSPDSILKRSDSNVNFENRRNAVFGVSSELLPQIEAETREISRYFNSASLLNAEAATVDRLAEELRSCDGFVHIAAHASRSSENPLFSRMIMADGPFFPFDLFGEGVSASLVTLSGCQTAAPGLYYGNSFSLARAFYLAGGKYVLASLWPVSDKLSMVFMTEFYAALHNGSDIYDAYRKAVLALRRLEDNPAFWGAFIILGI